MQATSTVPAYLLWFGVTGLSIARSLGRRGIPVVALHDHAREVCLSSRFAEAHVLPRISDDEGAWLNFLIQRGRSHAPGKAALFVASDEMWLFTARHRAALDPYFHIPLPRDGELIQWPNKEFQYKAAERAGIAHPRIMTPRTRSELDAAAAHVRYPCLLKPALSHLWVNQYREKLAFVRTRAELIDRGRDALQRGLPFVLQEYVPGGDDAIYGLFAYLDRNSKPLASIVSHKIRQYEPRFGSGCMSESADEPRVSELGLRLVQIMGFHGICSVEFKRDARDGQFKLMEINVRAPLMISVAERSGVDLPYIAYCDLLGLPVELPGRIRIGRRVGLMSHDIHTARFYRQLGDLSLPRWIASWLGATDLHFAWDDMRPFRHYVRSLMQQWRQGRYRALPPSFPSMEAWRAGEWKPDTSGEAVPAGASRARPAA